jgi:hypothetical protein
VKNCQNARSFPQLLISNVAWGAAMIKKHHHVWDWACRRISH